MKKTLTFAAVLLFLLAANAAVFSSGNAPAAVAGEPVEEKILQPDEDKIIAYVREHGSIDNTQCRELLNVDIQRASYLLKRLAGKGFLKREGGRRWACYRLS